MRQQGPNKYNVVGSYPDMREARAAIQALQFAGVEARDIALLGEKADEATEKADHETVTATRDAGMALRIVRRAVLFAIPGAIAGAVLGLVLAGIGFEVARIGDSPAVQAASWAMFGLVVGALIGAYSAFSIAEAWELTFEPVDDGEIFVEVHSEDAKEVEKAAHVLREKGARRVARFDGGGRPQPA